MAPEYGPSGYPAWCCPACGEKIEGVGPTTLSLAVSNHIHDRHERRMFASGPSGGVSGSSGTPQALTGAVLPFDEAFYDGARLTSFDRGFLRPIKISWTSDPE